MDVAKLYSLIGKLTDQQLGQEMSKPSGMAPLYMVMAEMDRRARMRKGSQQQPQAYADGGSVGAGGLGAIATGGPPAEEEFDYSQWELPVQVALAEDPQQLPAVLAVIANRARQANQTPAQVVTARNQFEPYGNGRYAKVDRARVRAAMQDPRNQAIMRGQIPESLRGLDHFYAPEAQRRLGRAAPTWDNGRGVDIGRQRYFALGYGGRPGPGTARGATPPPPAPPNTNPLDPQALGQNSDFAMDGITRRLGMDGKPPSFDGAYEQVAARNPDVLTPAYAQLLEQLQGQRSQYDRSNRGRPLMEMGLAMMNARGPNFFQALGQGGQAGLAARDRVQAGQRDIMGQLMQAQLGSAQAQAQRNQALTGAASSMYGQQFGGLAQAMGMANNQAAQMAQIAQGNRQAQMEDRRLTQQAAQDAAQRAEQTRQFNAEQALRERSAPVELGPDSTPEESRRWMNDYVVRGLENYDKNHPRATAEQKAAERARLAKEAEGSARYIRWGATPGAPVLPEGAPYDMSPGARARRQQEESARRAFGALARRPGAPVSQTPPPNPALQGMRDEDILAGLQE